MDNFGNYLKKKRSELFFFIKNCTLAVLRFSNRCEIVDMVTGEVLTTLKVNAVSEVVYCEKHDKLFLKSILNGYIYVYDFSSETLKRIFKLSESDRGIFLSHDGERLIAYSFGIIYEINTETAEYHIIYEADNKCFYKLGLDNPNRGCYEFIYGSAQIPDTICRISYRGDLLEEKLIIVDNIPMGIYDMAYSPERDLYVMQGYKNYIAAGLEPKNYCFIAICKNDIENIIYSSKEDYGGGCYCTLFHKSDLIYCSGNENIKVLNLDRSMEMKNIPLNSTVFSIQYDTFRNRLYIGMGSKCDILENFL